MVTPPASKRPQVAAAVLYKWVQTSLKWASLLILLLAGTARAELRMNWSQIQYPRFSPRYGHACVAFQNKIWVIGGHSNEGYLNDVWSSEDGEQWTLVNPAAAFAPRAWHEVLIKDNMLWVIAGTTNNGELLHDVWRSDNGADWTYVNSPRFQVVVRSALRSLMTICGWSAARSCSKRPTITRASTTAGSPPMAGYGIAH